MMMEGVKNAALPSQVALGGEVHSMTTRVSSDAFPHAYARRPPWGFHR